ncbi:MAG: hypothetical protein O7E52_10295 [Candidatus Poribacteria bacterium]|nr:hypothetical protein [Candidatus Poribacteria bacterium]
MAELHFDFRDVFRAGRYGFSGKKITVHFLGLVFAYLIYEILVYASLLISGGSAAKDFWNAYALMPVCPFVDYVRFFPITIGAMWIGTFILFVIFFLTSTMVSKITIQQLRGDHFFSMKDSLGFVKQNWKAVFGILVSLIVLVLLLALTPIIVGLLGKIPGVGRVILALASILTPLAFFLGLLIAYLFIILSISLFFAPSVVAAADADTFETVYQHFSIVWNQPWRVIVYETLLFGLKLICVPIWGIFCLAGFALAMLPIRLLIPTDMKIFMGHVNEWLGSRVQVIEKLAELPYMDKLLVFDTVSPASLPVSQISGFDLFFIKVTSILMTASLLFIAGLVIAYLFSIASAGNTLIYTILRRRTDGQNLLEVEEEEVPELAKPEATSTPTEETTEGAEEGTENQSSAEEKSE